MKPISPMFDMLAGSVPSATWSLKSVLSPSDILLDVVAATKRDVLARVSTRIASRTGGIPDSILEALLYRERLASTYVGNGIAMPHGRDPTSCRPGAAILRLRNPVDFEAPGGGEADIILALIWPDADVADFLPTLVGFWRLLRSPSAGQTIREARDVHQLYTFLEKAGNQPQ